MKQYLDNLRNIYENGTDHADRTGKGRRSIFGTQYRYDISDGTLPVVTTRKVFTRAIIEELLWFIKGSSDTKPLMDSNINIWNQWLVTEKDAKAYIEKHLNEADDEHKKQMQEAILENCGQSIGPLYGSMWRNAPAHDNINLHWPQMEMDEFPSDKLAEWTKIYEEVKFISGTEIADFKTFCNIQYRGTVDQLNELLLNLKKRPYSSRHVVSAWIPCFVPFEGISPQENIILGKGALAACHAFFQCLVIPPKEEGGKKRLNLMLTIRSNDAAVGKIYNIAQYSLLLALLAHVTDMEPYEFVLSVGDDHIYLNQMESTSDIKEGVETQLKREPLPLPKLWINPEVKDLFAFTKDDIRIEGYESHPAINYPVAM